MRDTRIYTTDCIAPDRKGERDCDDDGVTGGTVEGRIIESIHGP